MSVENIWPNKVEYSIVVPQKAIVFGSAVPLETRFTPLLKGLEITDISVKLIEVHDIILMGMYGVPLREYKKEKEVTSWALPVSREEHWQDVIEDTEQEGWVVNANLDLPRKLGVCIQDVNVHGIKVRHKLKLVVSLKNPDGHISELRATLPITIFISPNIPLDAEGNLTRPQQVSDCPGQLNNIAPPGYGEHVLDQLYDEIDTADLQTPAVQSGVNSPMYSHSRSGSHENLAAMASIGAVAPAALTSRLQSMSMDASSRPSSFISSPTISGANTPYSGPAPQEPESHNTSPPPSAPLSRHHSGESGSGHDTPEHVDYPEMSVLCKVPSYATAMRTTRVTPLSGPEQVRLPDYQTAVSAPGSPSASSTPRADPLSLIPEESHNTASDRRPAMGQRRHTGSSLSIFHGQLFHSGDADERRRLHLMQARFGVA